MSKITKKELDLLFPETEVELAGHTFKIKPFSFVETRTVATKLGPVMHLFSSDMTPASLAVIYTDAFDGIVDVMQMVYGIDKSLIEQFDQATALKAIIEIVNVNKNFFSDRVETHLTDVKELMSEDKSSTGNK